MGFPRIVISALRGGSGKTVLSLGLVAALRQAQKSISPFKKGPDYIDAGWLALAAGQPCYNLDSFLVSSEKIISSFFTHAQGSDISIIEGNRGLYDGIDYEGSTSTAELAKLLKAPVILCLDCTKSTRTIAASVLGCLHFDKAVDLKGVVLNRVAGKRHEQTIRDNVEYHCGIPVLGAIPKLGDLIFPERHMGLIPTAEHGLAETALEAAADTAKKYIDIDACLAVAENADALNKPPLFQISDIEIHARKNSDSKPQIGILKDSAFQFYYPENIDALSENGAELHFLSPLADTSLPNLDAIYIGGGFPETHAEALAENRSFRNRIKAMADDGLPIYAECGGLMYMGEQLVLGKKSYPMTGILPIVFGFSKRPQGHGYTVVTVENENPYYNVGDEIKGHEFHYSNIIEWRGSDKDMAFKMKRGKGFLNARDGIFRNNVFATYTHIHATGTTAWADAIIKNACLYKKKKGTLV
ncbi:MAG: cobyrinate a,c-diamide synthase [Desulfobacterales bacterium]|nr:cobyrinate a,c-diamide synthase [Desulfobacterales bacterium]